MRKYQWLGLLLGLLQILALSGCVSDSGISAVITNAALPVDPISYISDNQVWLASSDGTSQMQLSDVAKSDSLSDTYKYFSPVWFPNQTDLLYGVQAEDYYELWMQTVPAGQPQFLLATRQQPHHIAISPNNQYLLYFETVYFETEEDTDVLFMFDIESGTGQRLHEGAVDASWAPDSKSIVFTTTDQRLLLQEFRLNEELDDPKVLLEAAVRKPIFVDQTTIAYEGAATEGAGTDAITLLELDLISLQATPITSLRFDGMVDDTANYTSGPISLALDPNGKRLLYVRPDEVTLLPNVWVIPLDKDLPKLILTNVNTPIWSQIPDLIIYLDVTINDSGEAVPTINTSSAAGLHKTTIIQNGHSVVSGAQSISNEYRL